MSLLPLPLLYWLSWPLFLLIYYLPGYRKNVVRQNLRSAFPEKSEAELALLTRKFYKQLADVALEILKTRSMPPADIKRRVKVVNPTLLEQLSEGFTRSVVVLAIHQGNWEWMLHGVKLALDIPVDPVFKPLRNRSLNQIALEIRSRFGSQPVELGEVGRNILRHRRDFRLFALVADQAPSAAERYHRVLFLQRETAFHVGAESLVRSTALPVVFAQCSRSSRGHYAIQFKAVAIPPYNSEGYPITERYASLAEEAILNEPESWLWTHRRWKQ
ncbi:MAG: lysophospholipid acyltransferase family protein [Pseudomonadota bacterium]